MLYNTETGEQFKNPKTYKATAASGLSVGGQVLNQEDISVGHIRLNNTRPPLKKDGSGKPLAVADRYADTGEYMKMLDEFVNAGGAPQDFIKEYDPNVYINPKDETRSFLQAAMKKPASGNVFLGGLGMDFDSIIAEAESEVGG